MKKYLQNGGLILLGLVASLSTASAAVPVAVTTALTDSATDVATIGGAVLAILVVVAAFRYMKRTF